MRDPESVAGTRDTEKPQQPRYAIVARASAAGILFPLSIVAGFLIGRWLGRALGWGDVPAFVGAALGAVAGFWNLYRLLRGLDDSAGRR